MKNENQTVDELIAEYHQTCQALFNTYRQIADSGVPVIDARLKRLRTVFEKHSCMMNLFADLSRRMYEQWRNE